MFTKKGTKISRQRSQDHPIERIGGYTDVTLDGMLKEAQEIKGSHLCEPQNGCLPSLFFQVDTKSYARSNYSVRADKALFHIFQ